MTNSYIEELKAEIDEEQNVDDINESEEDEGIVRYEITSYGIDFDVDGLVKRLKRGDIYIPEFQREFVWKLPESSRLIESLLLGLPVPGIFLAQDPESGKLLVIDGQQRLLSLLYFFEEHFNYKDGDEHKRVFKLSKVQKQFLDKTYSTLESKDRINLENCVIHATVVKQDTPAVDDTSIYHIFERLNSGGRKLTPQEIRSAVYHGELVERVKKLNHDANWRAIYGKVNERMKDQELITRFFAMLNDSENYKEPMKDFINLFSKRFRKDNEKILDRYSSVFCLCCEIFMGMGIKRPFRFGPALNVAFFEAAMVGLAYRIITVDTPDVVKVLNAYNKLTQDDLFIKSISQSTGNTSSVKYRIEASKAAFLGV